MKYDLKTTEHISVPDNVKVEIKGREVTVKGKRGQVRRSFNHLKIQISEGKFKGKKVIFITKWLGLSKLSSAVNSCASHISNMILGVTRGFKYVMRTVHAHFPINCFIADQGSTLEIRNFLGEKHAKIIKMLPGVTVKRNEASKNEIWIEGSDINNVSLSCALINQACRVRGKDIRKFLDGVYVEKKIFVENEEE